MARRPINTSSIVIDCLLVEELSIAGSGSDCMASSRRRVCYRRLKRKRCDATIRRRFSIPVRFAFSILSCSRSSIDRRTPILHWLRELSHTASKHFICNRRRLKTAVIKQRVTYWVPKKNVIMELIRVINTFEDRPIVESAWLRFDYNNSLSGL